MKLSEFFLPHPKTHKKAHLISSGALAIYFAFFIFLQIFLSFLSTVKPGILGISFNVTSGELIKLTNLERAKRGLSPLSENSQLDQAATLKANNMFEEDYWAHYSPSGKDPWGFFVKAGYRFTHAGENLARNFYNSSDIVNAWMASPTHRDNLLNANYKEIGIAVLEGNLGSQPTVLVVQEFGSPIKEVATLPQVKPTSTPIQETAGLTAGVRQVANKPLLDPYIFTKEIGLSLIAFLMVLLAIDLYIIRRRAVVRLTSRHLPHLVFLSVAASTLLNLSPGAIL